jgi:hypothetical protein
MCQIPYYNDISKAVELNCFITGTPGIGKSLFMIYLSRQESEFCSFIILTQSTTMAKVVYSSSLVMACQAILIIPSGMTTYSVSLMTRKRLLMIAVSDLHIRSLNGK